MKSLISLALAMILALLAGCGGPEDQDTGSTTAPSTSGPGVPTMPSTTTPGQPGSAATGGPAGGGETAGTQSPRSGDAPGEKAGGTGEGPAKVAAKAYTTTSSGLKYAVLKRGKGEGAKSGDTVRVHYTGWLTDGTKFDSSLDRNEPFEVTIDEPRSVIQGWHEGLKGMRPGEKRQLVVPPALAYGSEGRPGIPPDATLIFEVEIVEKQ